MQLKANQTCSIFAWRIMTFKTSIHDGIKILSGTTEMPPENVFEGLYKKKLQVSEQLQTVLAVYSQELNRDQVIPGYPKWRKRQDNILIRR